MIPVLIGNILSLIGAVLLILGGLSKTKKGILSIQIAGFSMMAGSNLALGGITGVVVNFISIMRNFICLKFPYTRLVKSILLAVQITLGLTFNNMGAIGLLPIFANCLIIWTLDSENVIFLKIMMILVQILWIFYDLSLQNYVAVAFDVSAVFSNIIGIISIRKTQKAA